MRLRHLVMSSLAVLVLGTPAAAAAENGPAPAPLPAPEVGDRDLSIEVTDKPLETVLQWISRRAGVNVVCYEQEQPRVTLRLSNITWQEAVNAIAAKYDLVVESRTDRVWVLARPPKVRMEFNDADLRLVLEALARQAGVNIVMSGEVVAKGRTLTMTLNGVPWKEALDVITKTVDLAWVQTDYKIIRIVAPESLSKDQRTEVVPLNYAKAEDIKPQVDAAMGSDGKSDVEKRSNSLVLSGTPPAIDKAKSLLRQLDSRTREVLIEMKFVDFAIDDARKIGFDGISLAFDWEHVGRLQQSFDPFTNGSQTFFDRINATSPIIPGNTGPLSAALTLQMLSTLSSTEVLQAPQILTLDNTQAKITVGREIHFAEEKVTTENGVSTRTLQEAATSPVKDGIAITVTPHITSDGFITIDLDASNDQVNLDEFSSGSGVNASKIKLPNKKTTVIKNTIMVGNGKTAVIGGILDNKIIEAEGHVPGFASVPLLGWLFRKENNSTSKRNLTIFITPRIVPLGGKNEFDVGLESLRTRLAGPGAASEAKPATANPGQGATLGD